MHYFAGLDLGRLHEYTALAVVELTRDVVNGASLNRYSVRHLERFPIGTPYPMIVDRVVELFGESELVGNALTIDRTGVGQPVVELFENAGIDAELRSVVVTSGLQVTFDSAGWLVPKLELVGVLQVLFQSRRLLIAADLHESATLVQELANFRAKPPATTGDPYLDWRDGPHDDLVLAVAVAVWQGEREDWQDECDAPFAWGRGFQSQLHW